jgi:NADPH:quinone reductase-like Zn-dependent oxidoreductase
MRAISVDEYGAAPELSELPDPQAGPGQVLIKIQVAGINPMDRPIAAGAMQTGEPPEFPLVLGSDLVGVVESLGEGAGRFSAGEELFGELPLGRYGSYAEYVAVSEDAPLVLLPKALARTTAAALPTPGVTALQIVESLESLSGKSVLIVGAAGGVGSFVTQLAAHSGAHVVAIDRADAGDRLRAYGAVETVDSAAASVRDEVRRSHSDGVDILVDLVSSDAAGFAALAELVRPGGIALSTRYAADAEALLSRGVTGVNFQVAMTTEALERIGNLVAAGSIVAAPINVITLEEVFGPSGALPLMGKTVIALP